MKKCIYPLFLVTLMATGFFSCTEKDGSDTTLPPKNETGENAVTPIGQPTGEVVSKTIGAEGGELNDALGSIHIVIPAGALKTPTQVSIEPITNHCPGGLSDGFRLLPHGQVFEKPVTVRFRYTDDAVDGSFEAALGVAYQDDKQMWRSVKSSERDTSRNEIAIQTTHFSDWTMFAALQLDPMIEAISPGESIAVLVHYHFKPTEDDDLLAPLVTNAETVLQNATSLLDPKFIEKWEKQGEGVLAAQANKAKYTAPGKIPQKNPVEIVVRIRNGKTVDLLVSRIFVAPPGISVSVNDGAWHNIAGGGYTKTDGKNLITAYEGGHAVKILYGGTRYGVYAWTQNTVICTYTINTNQTYYQTYGNTNTPSPGKLHVTYKRMGSNPEDVLILGTFDVQKSRYIDASYPIPVISTQRMKGIFRVQSLL